MTEKARENPKPLTDEQRKTAWQADLDCVTRDLEELKRRPPRSK